VNKILFAIHMKLQDLLSMEEGQDLVEYALTVALIALGAVASMRALSAEIKTAFNAVSSDLGTSL
jgi:pilus assembly protein Flp/PilA